MREVVFQKTPGGAYKINPIGIISLPNNRFRLTVYLV
jgi:hypothetical protein